MGTVQFTAAGGDGNYTFEFVDNVSGGTIDFQTGLYTAGSTKTGRDRVQVLDGTGITAEATIRVLLHAHAKLGDLDGDGKDDFVWHDTSVGDVAA